MAYYNEILPGLFLGNIVSASYKPFLKDKNIKLIINCAKEIPNFYKKDFVYLNVPIGDTNSYQDNQDLYNLSSHVLDVMRLYHLYSVKNVLVHCAAGISRSSSIVAAYLIKYHRMNVIDSITFIRNKRPMAFYYGNRVNFKKALKKIYFDTQNKSNRRITI